MRHHSSLVCMVGITNVYIDTIFAFYGYFPFISFFLCPSLLLSWMFGHDWTHAVLGVLYVCVLYLHLFSTTEHVSHGKAL